MRTLTSDTLKILLPADAIEPGFEYYSVRTGNKPASYMPGLHSIKPAIGNRNEAVIEISSKILQGPELIHWGNIEDVFTRVNESGLIAIHPDAIEQAYSLTIDPATDVVIPNSQEVLEVINTLAYHPDYRKQKHRGNQNTTFYYQRAKTGKHVGKAKVYDKAAEDKQGVHLPGTIRFELTCPNSLAIQHAFGVTANNQGRILLKDVLQSSANPVADKFEKILASLYTMKPQYTTSMEVVESAVGVDKEQVFRKALKSRKEIDTFNMLTTQHYDLDNVYSLLRPTVKSRVGKPKTLEPYVEMLAQYNSFDEELTVDYHALMSIRELLRGGDSDDAPAVAMAA